MELLSSSRTASTNGASGGKKRLPTIVIDIPLNNDSVSVDFMQLAERQYGWAAVHPVEARFRALNRLDSDEDEGGSESERDAGSGEEAGAESSAHELGRQPRRPKKKKRRTDIEYYDTEDPFIDDDELNLQATAATAKDGFFVWHGPLVPEGERAKVEKAPGRSTRKRKRPPRLPSSRVKATAERAASIAERQKEIERQKELEENEENKRRAQEAERRAREVEHRAAIVEATDQRQETSADETVAANTAPVLSLTTPTTPSAKQHTPTSNVASIERPASQTAVIAHDNAHELPPVSSAPATPTDANLSVTTSNEAKRVRPRAPPEVLARRAAMRREQRAAKKAKALLAAAATSSPSASVAAPSRPSSPGVSQSVSLAIPSTPTPEPVPADSPAPSSTAGDTPGHAKRRPQTEEQKAAARRRRERYKLNRAAQSGPQDELHRAKLLAKAILNPAIDTSRIPITDQVHDAVEELRSELVEKEREALEKGDPLPGVPVRSLPVFDATQRRYNLPGKTADSPSGHSMSVNSLIT
ncbi:HIR complex subunit [Savitreella phatthalungensis]